MDWFLLNSNKRCESENTEGTSSTSGKIVKKRKNRKYDHSYFWALVLRRQKAMAKRGRISEIIQFHVLLYRLLNWVGLKLSAEPKSEAISLQIPVESSRRIQLICAMWCHERS
jgi:hypothetical protein